MKLYMLYIDKGPDWTGISKNMKNRYKINNIKINRNHKKQNKQFVDDGAVKTE